MKTNSLLAVVALASVTSALPVFDSTQEDFYILGKRAPATVFGKCTQPNTVALTFDDGPYKWHKDVTDLLNKAGAKGTFFVNGQNWDCIYGNDVANQLLQSYKDGHQIGSHTWSHVNMTNVSSSQMSTELSRIDTALKKILGVKAAFLRPPYGAYNDTVRQLVGNNGQQMVYWDFDNGDSVGKSVNQSIALYDARFAKKPTSILALNHETYDGTVHKILPYVLNKYGKSGYRFVTVAECLGMKPYSSIGTPGKRDSSWKC